MALMKRLRIIGSTLRYRDSEFKAKLVSDFNENLVHLFKNGTFKPVIHSTTKIDLHTDSDASKVEDLFT